MKEILLIAGTRPNFIKLAPLYHRLRARKRYKVCICHTGQHFDYNMSDIFWENLDLPAPDYRLKIKGDSVPDIIGNTIIGINDIIKNHVPDLVVVFGDVNATVAGAIAAAHGQVKLMHVEAGLRSFDRSMPEEINRVITDHISDYLMVSEESGLHNLEKEGFVSGKYQLVGNIMIESLLNTREKWEKICLPEPIQIASTQNPAIFTFHRPENVDCKETLMRIVEIVEKVSTKFKAAIFPLHPRTKLKLVEFGLYEEICSIKNLVVTEPLSYFSFLKIVSSSGLVITDSGGVQEETSFLNIPCVTFRKNTERPVTVRRGTNCLLDIWSSDYLPEVISHMNRINSTEAPKSIPLWDDQVSERIAAFTDSIFGIEQLIPLYSKIKNDDRG